MTKDTTLPSSLHDRGHIYRADIDGLRAVAVLLVVAFHLFPDVIKGGFIGVDVFFVISGFLISTLIFADLERRHFSFVDFYARRVRRIFPALFLVLGASLLYGFWNLMPDDFSQLGKHIAGGAGFVSNLILWQETGYFDGAAESKPLLHLWSLGIEEQFYIVWPILLILGHRLRLDMLKVMGGIAFLSFGANIYCVHHDAMVAFYAPFTRLWELAVGSCLAYWHFHTPRAVLRRFFAHTAGGIGLGLIAVGVFFLTKKSLFPGYWALLPTGGAALILTADPRSWINRFILSNRFFVWIGLISYPLYLWHWPILVFAKLRDIDITDIKVKGWVALATLVCAVTTYIVVERPIRLGRHKASKALIVFLLMLDLGLVGFYVYSAQGLSNRFPPIIRSAIVSHYDAQTAYREKTCFLKDNADSVFGDCASTPLASSSPSVFLWGDSHAAHLYPGFKALIEPVARVTQLNAGGCPPILGYAIKERPNCMGINETIVQRIMTEKPDRVVMAAVWSNHDWRQMRGTIDRLKTLGIRQIDVVGPVPLWQGSLPRSLFNLFQREKIIPDRTFHGVLLFIKSLDGEMKAFVETLGVRYISPWSILCNDEGCLTRLGDTPETLTAWDYGHLTSAGSVYVVGRFPDGKVNKK